jgi:hypothetical protein
MKKWIHAAKNVASGKAAELGTYAVEKERHSW